MSKEDLKLGGENCPCTGESNLVADLAAMRDEAGRPKLLLHSCCGPCSSAVIERLAQEYSITVFFYNPCITDNSEYEKRRAEQIKFIDMYNQKYGYGNNVTFVEGEYDPQEYFLLTKGHEKDPEGGERCTICFYMRLRKTAIFAKTKGYDLFTTTLTVSPHKNYTLISKIGKDVGAEMEVDFLDIDFKKKSGFQRSIQLSKEYGLYRQHYCGCLYSIRETLD